MEQKCANCGNGKWRDGVTPMTDICTKCHYVNKGALVPQPSNWIPKEQTNADRIRAMSDEEMADIMSMHTATGACNDWGIPHKKCGGNCRECIIDWLKQPAEVDNG